MSEADKLQELFDIAWDIQIHNKDKNEELVKKLLSYMPDIMQQFDYLENKEITPSKTLEELGYKKKRDDEYHIIYEKRENETLFYESYEKHYIIFWKNEKRFDKRDDTGKSRKITMEELKAIYKYCEELGWI